MGGQVDHLLVIADVPGYDVGAVKTGYGEDCQGAKENGFFTVVDDLAEPFFVLRAVGIADYRLCACGDTKIDADEEVEDVDVDGHSRNAVLAGKLDNGDVKEDCDDTGRKLGEHFAGAVKA